MRREYDRFQEANITVVVVGPEDTAAFTKHFEAYDLPFLGIPDPEFRILDLYGQQVKMIRMGRMPAQVMIDSEGIVRFAHYASSMSDIPRTDAMLELAAGMM